MERVEGQPLPLGADVRKDRINFSVEVPEGKECSLILYKKGEKEPFQLFEMKEEDAVGHIRFLALKGQNLTKYEYNYLVGKEVLVDPMAKKIVGRKHWNEKKDVQEHEVRAGLYEDKFDWEEDKPLLLPQEDVVAYSLHVRGFTKHSSSKAVHKGTFKGVIEKIPYLKELGVNQIHCMPFYEFEECLAYTNYWGYGDGFFFAPKSAYASNGDGVTELKMMIKACHKEGIEVIVEMPFGIKTPAYVQDECLRHYLMEYHVDGFILNPLSPALEVILSDPLLKASKLLKHQDDFQNTMRRFLKGDEGMVGGAIYWLRHKEDHLYNYVTGQSGFTLRDLVSYDGKHNEENNEKNTDGTDYNYSWNCGVEGPSRKKSVVALRKNQIRNAMFLLLLAQGTPCILAGDEMGNSQKGNNNAYCQDNAIGWVEWTQKDKEKELWNLIHDLIAFRKKHPVFAQKRELLGQDHIHCGVPDVSYHGQYAWQVPDEMASRQLGIYYCGKFADDDDCFVAYNMHWEEHGFALPSLKGHKKWYLAASTEEGVLEKPRLLESQKETEVKERTIEVFVAM